MRSDAPKSVINHTTAGAPRALATTIGKGTALGIVANVVQIVTRLITVPIVIGSIGLGGYGIWNVLMAIAAYMRFGSVGIKSAFQKYVAEATGDGDYQKANKLLSTGCALMFLLSLGVLLPAAVGSRSIAEFAGVPHEFRQSVTSSISLLALIMVLANTGAAFEAIVMGGHRIDLIRKANMVLAIAEAAAIAFAARHHYGLFAMSVIMGVSELVYVMYCYVEARRTLPQVRVSYRFLTSDVLYELFRFAGSYQLVNVLEILYASIIPVALLKAFGANSAGTYAVVARIVTAAAILQESFLSPILSSGAMVYASGSQERMLRLVVNAFRITFGLSVFPLGFIVVFGPAIAYAWTNQTDPLFRASFWLVGCTAFFKSISLVSLVLYRVSGSAVLDNLRQLLRIAIVVVVGMGAGSLGFYGVLWAFAGSEFCGMLFMLFALSKTFRFFRVQTLLPEVCKLAGAALLTFAIGYLVYHLPLPLLREGRLLATVKLGAVLVACFISALPSLLLTGSVTAQEGRTLVYSILPLTARNSAPAV